MKFSPLIIFFILLVLTVSFVSAQPPFPSQVLFDEGFIIEFSQVDNYQFGRDLLFNAHVFNISNGVRILNASTDCNFHLFDTIGIHIINQNPMPFDSVGLDWELSILRGNFTRLGSYSYLVVCNNSAANLGGFVTVGFEVTPDGKPSDVFPVEFSIILFALVLIIFGLTKERYRILQIIGGMIWIVIGVITLFPGYNLINWTTLTGKLLGFSLIGLGFYFLIENSFSRDEQDAYFTQRGGEND